MGTIRTKRGSAKGAPPSVVYGMIPIDGAFTEEFARSMKVFLKWAVSIVVGLLVLSILFSLAGIENPPKMKHRKIKVLNQNRR